MEGHKGRVGTQVRNNMDMGGGLKGQNNSILNPFNGVLQNASLIIPVQLILI